jgi:hypothetical protein
VGDGATPRTAALFAFLSKAGQCFAIDPLLEQGATSAANKSSSATATATATHAAEVRQQSEHNAQFFSKLSSGAGRAHENKESRSSAKQSAALVAHPWQTIRRISVKLFHEPTFSPPLCHVTNLTKLVGAIPSLCHGTLTKLSELAGALFSGIT